MDAVQLPVEENLLLSAYRSVMERSEADAPAELVADYERYFTTEVVPTPGKSLAFERFSLIDSTVRLTVKSNTAPV